MFKRNKPKRYSLLALMLTMLVGCFTACSDGDDNGGSDGYNPSKSVVITDFIPKKGGVGQKLVVYGNNFGNDTSLVKVKIGGKPATLINVNNEGLYCFVPQGAYKGNIEVTVGDEQQGNQQTLRLPQRARRPGLARRLFRDRGWLPQRRRPPLRPSQP